eukprot:GEMP01039248.1.p1 GENE.GEMP01039248.1~~GEMP01039248.1.p1  ORF type:complete len:375 (+),score=62.71 GEMP01039248.1:309-1433(+)
MELCASCFEFCFKGKRTKLPTMAEPEPQMSMEMRREKLEDVALDWDGEPNFKDIWDIPFKKVFDILHLHAPLCVAHDEPIRNVVLRMSEENVRVAVVTQPKAMPTILEDAHDVLPFRTDLIDFNDVNHAILNCTVDCMHDDIISVVSAMSAGGVANMSRQNETTQCSVEDPVGEVLTVMARKEIRRVVIYAEDGTLKGIFHISDALELFQRCAAVKDLLSQIPTVWVPRQEHIGATRQTKLLSTLEALKIYNHTAIPIISCQVNIVGVIGIRDISVLFRRNIDGNKLLMASLGDFLQQRGFISPICITRDSSLDVVLDALLESRKARIVLCDDRGKVAGMVSSSAIVWMVWPVIAQRLQEIREPTNRLSEIMQK